MVILKGWINEQFPALSANSLSTFKYKKKSRSKVTLPQKPEWRGRLPLSFSWGPSSFLMVVGGASRHLVVMRLLLVFLESFVWFKVCSASLVRPLRACWPSALYKDFLVSFLPFLMESLFLTYPRFLLAVWGETEPGVCCWNRPHLIHNFNRTLHACVGVLQQEQHYSGSEAPAHLFGRVLLLGAVGSPEFVLHAVSVLQLFDLVNPHQPVLRRERLLQVLQLYVLVADLSIACPIEARRRPEVQLKGVRHHDVS